MAGTLGNAPGDIIRWLLARNGLGSGPTWDLPWPIWYSQKPNQPDNLIWLVDSTGTAEGDTQPDGEVQTHYGFQVLLRATTDLIGWVKMNSIFIFFQTAERKRVTVTDTQTGIEHQYLIDNVSKIGNIIPLGNEPETKRVLYSLNAATTLRQLS